MSTLTFKNMDFSLSEFLAGSAIGIVVKEGISYWKRKTETKVDLAQNTKDISDVHRIMENVVSNTFYNRFMVFVGEDSAGILAAGKNLYITAQYEKLLQEEGVEIKPIIDTIQRWKADTNYYDMFSKMLSEGSVKIKTSDMPPSRLKDIYLMQGVKSCKVYHLMTTKDHSKVFFCSVASTIREEATDEDRVVIGSAIDKLIDIFKRHQKFY
jgi:hypothetical protein